MAEAEPIIDGTKTFVVWDYLVFALVLAVSAGIGIYYGCTGGKQKTTGEFLMANRQMSLVPVAMSLLASFMSAITLLGTPAEIYVYGTIYWWIWIGYLFLIPFAAHVFLPLFYRLKVTSVYEYLEMRFKSKAIRMCVAITFSVQMSLYMAIVLYAPSLALSQVTGLNVWISVCSVGIVCTFYTSIGGMKAVMWTDTFQICIMFAGLFAVLIQGSINAGGFGEIWKANDEWYRIEFEDFSPDPFKRHTFWTLSVGGFFTWLAIYGVNQAQIQRALCVPKLRDAQIALWINLPGLTALLTICGLCGLVIFHQYRHCDPLTYVDELKNQTESYVKKSDQLLPFYVMEQLSHVPGLPGLFTACLFSGALSTISSGLNSLSAVALQDIIKTTRWKDISEERATIATKVIAVAYGALCLGLTYVASLLGSVLQAALALFGVIGGPQLGVFLLAILFPCANWIGATVGLFTSLILTMWVMVGNQIVKPDLFKLPVTTEGCNITNMTLLDQIRPPNISLLDHPDPLNGIEHWYELSYMHYGTFAVLVVLIVGVVVSLLTGPMKSEDIDPILIITPWDVCCCFLPQSWRDACRCKIEQYIPTDEDIMVVAEKSEPEGEAGAPKEEAPPPYSAKTDHPGANGSVAYDNPAFNHNLQNRDTTKL